MKRYWKFAIIFIMLFVLLAPAYSQKKGFKKSAKKLQRLLKKEESRRYLKFFDFELNGLSNGNRSFDFQIMCNNITKRRPDRFLRSSIKADVIETNNPNIDPKDILPTFNYSVRFPTFEDKVPVGESFKGMVVPFIRDKEDNTFDGRTLGEVNLRIRIQAIIECKQAS